MTGRNKWARWLALGLSFGLSIWIGLGVSDSIPGGTVDFQVVYYAARCLASHRDPYLLNELKATYIEEARKLPAGDIDRPQAVTWLIYPPTMFPLVAPFLLLGWNTARWVWTLLLIAGLFASTILILQTRPRAAPMVSLILLCILLANSEVVIGGGNTAGLAVALGVLGIWCVIEERWVTTGVFLLALSLLLKPHDAGLVWCFLLLAGGAVRKRALQTLMVVVVLGTLSLAWVGRTAPNWSS